MGQWTNYEDSTTPAGTWTILCYPGTGLIREVALSSVMTQLAGANYAKTLNVDAALSASPQTVEVGGLGSGLSLSTSGIVVGALVADSVVIATDRLDVSESGIFMDLPTVDPEVANALWVDVAANRVIKHSAG